MRPRKFAPIKYRVLGAQLDVEEDTEVGAMPPLSTLVSTGDYPSGAGFAVFVTKLDHTIHVVGDNRPNRRVSLASLIDSIVNAKPKPRPKRPAKPGVAKPERTGHQLPDLRRVAPPADQNGTCDGHGGQC